MVDRDRPDLDHPKCSLRQKPALKYAGLSIVLLVFSIMILCLPAAECTVEASPYIPAVDVERPDPPFEFDEEVYGQLSEYLPAADGNNSIIQSTTDGSIEGKITDSSGNPLPNTGVVAVGGTGFIVYTDTSGSYRKTGLLPGYYRISASPPTGSKLTGNSIVVHVGAGETATADIVLYAGGTLICRVTNENGTCLKESQVFAQGNTIYNGETDSSGLCTITGMRYGTYRISAYAPYGDYQLTRHIENLTEVFIAHEETVTINIVIPHEAVISGRVTDSSGKGIRYARVDASGLTPVTPASTVTDDEGYYQLQGLMESIYTLTVSPPWGNSNLVEKTCIISARLGETKRADFVLDAGGIISGRVSDTNGNAVREACISLSGPKDYPSMYTDSTGYYFIGNLKPGTYKLTISPSAKDNLLTGSIKTIVTGGTTTTVDAVLDPGGTISGRITTTAGAGIENIAVQIQGLNGSTTYTDSSGCYTINRLLAGKYTVTASASYRANFLESSITITLLGETATVDMVLETGGMICGRITDSSGKAISGIRIEEENLNVSGYIDPSGYYEIPRLRSGKYNLVVDPPFGSNYLAKSIEAVVTSGQTTSVDIILDTGAFITGRVVDSNNNAVSGTAVRTPDPGISGTVTDLSGIFLIQGFDSGTHSINVSAPPESDFLDKSIEVNVVRGGMAAVTIVLDRGGIITGTITDSSGRQIANVKVNANLSYNPPSTTSTSGVYLIKRLPEGSHMLDISAPSKSNLASRSVEAVVKQGEATILDIVLDPGGTISGRITDAKGRGVYSAYIVAYNPSFSSDCYSDVFGNYVIPGLPAGSYYVKVRPEPVYNLLDSSAWTSVVAGEVTTQDFSLYEGGIITGRVTNPSGEGMSCYIVLSGTCHFNKSTDNSGDYMITSLPAGDYVITASPHTNSNLVDTSRQIKITPGKVVNLDIVLDPGGTISGRIYHSDGTTPFKGIVVQIYAAESKTCISSCTTNAWGRYSRSGLPAGNYLVHASTSQVNESNNWHYISEWYPDVFTPDLAAPVSVAATGTANIDFILTEAGFPTSPEFTIVTYEADNITGSSATLDGRLNMKWPQPVTVYFEWGAAAGVINTTPPVILNGSANFSATIDGLLPGTYLYRAAGLTESGTVYSQYRLFCVQKMRTLTITINGSGYTIPPAGTYEYPEGTRISIHAVPLDGCRFARWEGETSAVTGITESDTFIDLNADYTITAGFISSGATLISDIMRNPTLYEGLPVEISGTYRGWESGHGSPPESRADWIIRDGTGSIYVTGRSLGLRHPADLGKNITVNGIIKLKQGKPYVFIP